MLPRPLFTILFLVLPMVVLAQRKLNRISKKIKSSTVILEVSFPTKYTNEKVKGCGIIIHEQNDSLFVLTTEHLFHLQDLPDIDPELEKIEVAFFGEPDNPQTAEIVRYNSDLDWAMLVVRKPSKTFKWWNEYHPKKKSLKKFYATIESNKSVKKKENVRLIVGEGEWLKPDDYRNGEIKFRRDQILRVQYDGQGSLPTYSGGPLIYRKGFAGLVVRQRGDGNVGDVLAADTIFSEIKKIYAEESILRKPRRPALFLGAQVGLFLNTHAIDQVYQLENGNVLKVAAGLGSDIDLMFGLLAEVELFKGFSLGTHLNYTEITLPFVENTGKFFPIFRKRLYTFSNDVFEIGGRMVMTFNVNDPKKDEFYFILGIAQTFHNPRFIIDGPPLSQYEVFDLDAPNIDTRPLSYSFEVGISGSADYSKARLGAGITLYESKYIMHDSLSSEDESLDVGIYFTLSFLWSTQKRTIKSLVLKN